MVFNGGWTGRVLRVNLTQNKTVTQPLSKKLAYTFIGGRGFTSKMLYDEVKPGIDPLGPENKLFMAVGPCNGTIVPGSTRITIAAKSPLSGYLGDSNSGGAMGSELKYAGYDMVIITGKVKKPTFLFIDDEEISFCDATHLWGKTTGETRRIIERELGDPQVKVASIGPAGENLVKFACIISGFGSAHGRCGMGAVMGSKNLKAIVVRGTKGVNVSNSKVLQETVNKMYTTFRQHEEWYTRYTAYGPSGGVLPYNKFGVLPTRNFQTGICVGAEKVSAENIRAMFGVSSRGCFSCPIAGKLYMVIGEDPFKGTFQAGLQTESLALFGSNLGNVNPHSVIKMHDLVNELGMDVADSSGVLAWATECFEKGIITLKDTEGIKLKWGDYDTYINLLQAMAYRKGFGHILAEGAKGATAIIGKGSEKYMMHVKGLIVDTRDPRPFRGWTLAYAVASRGAEHCRTLFTAEGVDLTRAQMVSNQSMEGKAEAIAYYEDFRALQNCMETCSFCGYFGDMLDPKTLLKLYKAVTGVNVDEPTFLKIGERITCIERAFNVREGLKKSEDTLPARFLTEPLPEGYSKGAVAILGPLIDEYYQLRGWEKETGFPTEKKLDELNLHDVIDDLKRIEKLG